MRVTFVVPEINMKGGSRVIVKYAEELSTLGHEVVILSPAKKKLSLKQKIKTLFKPRVQQTSIPYLTNDDVKFILLDKPGPINNEDVPDADIVIATWWETAFWVDNFSMSKGEKVYFCQDYGDAPGQPLDKIIESWDLSFKSIITISSYIEGLIKEYLPQQIDKVSVIANGVCTQTFNAPGRTKNTSTVFGFLYTKAPQKGFSIVLDAFLIAQSKVKDIQLLLFGNQPLPDEVKNIKNLSYVFHPADDELKQIYASCDAWLFATIREGFGLPILEAMSCRTPVIATKAGASPDIVDDSNGFLLDGFEPDEMAEKMLLIHEMSLHDWEDMSQKAFATSQKFSWDEASMRFNNELLRVLGKL